MSNTYVKRQLGKRQANIWPTAHSNKKWTPVNHNMYQEVTW